MKRDMDAIRTILLAVEADKEEIDVPGMSDGDICRHIALLKNADMLDGIDVSNSGSPCDEEYQNLKLTMAGHDFLEAIRSDTVWEKTKTEVKKSGGAFVIDVVRDVAVGIIRGVLFGNPLS